MTTEYTKEIVKDARMKKRERESDRLILILLLLLLRGPPSPSVSSLSPSCLFFRGVGLAFVRSLYRSVLTLSVVRRPISC